MLIIFCSLQQTESTTIPGRAAERHLLSIMHKTAALTACLASLAAALQLPTRRQFGLGVGTAVVVPPALAAGGKVVVVGGAGFVGTEICHLLATQGVKDVVSVSRRSAAAQAQKVQYEQFVDFVSLDASKDDLSSVSVWKSNFGRRTRCCLRSCVCSMAWRFQAIDATKVHEGSRNIST